MLDKRRKPKGAAKIGGRRKNRAGTRSEVSNIGKRGKDHSGKHRREPKLRQNNTGTLGGNKREPWAENAGKQAGNMDGTSGTRRRKQREARVETAGTTGESNGRNKRETPHFIILHMCLLFLFSYHSHLNILPHVSHFFVFDMLSGFQELQTF
jgi:hypothetical protein